MYLYQTTPKYFAQIADNIKELGAEELTALGAQDVRPVYRGIYFEADAAALYRINYCSRLVSKVLAPLVTFESHSTKYLYKKAKEVEWADFFDVDQTFAIFAQVSHSHITHSQYAALCVKDAIADYFRDKTGKRPSVDPTNPDVDFNVHIDYNRVIISLNTSGGSLHRRGYRIHTVEAPMQETVAAAIIKLTEWDGAQPLIDPFCGSGTLLCEALMSYCRIPAGYLRSGFGFKNLPDYEEATWRDVKMEADDAIRELPEGLISGSDVDAKAARATRNNLKQLPHGQTIKVTEKDARDIPSLENMAIVCNPPYGIRMKQKHGLEDFYKSIGDFLKKKCEGSSAYIYFGDRQFLKKIHLRAKWKKPLMNGGLDGRLAKFEMY